MINAVFKSYIDSELKTLREDIQRERTKALQTQTTINGFLLGGLALIGFYDDIHLIQQGLVITSAILSMISLSLSLHTFGLTDELFLNAESKLVNIINDNYDLKEEITLIKVEDQNKIMKINISSYRFLQLAIFFAMLSLISLMYIV